MTVTRPCGRDATAAGDAGGGFGKPARKRGKQLVIDGWHAAGDVVEGGAIELEHDRITDRDDGRRAQSSGKKGDLADRLTDTDFGQGNRLSLHPHLETAGDDDEDRVCRRILQHQCFAAQEVANLGARPDLGLLIA